LNVNSITRRVFLRSAGAGAAGLALGGWQAEAGAGATRLPASAPLQAVKVNAGFKQRTSGNAAQLVYGRTVRDNLHDAVLDSIKRARSQGHVAQFESAASMFERIAMRGDVRRLDELWLHVAGTVGGKYHSREYVVEL
jgi:hypothetical protein